MARRLGKSTILMESDVSVSAFSSAVGKKEGESLLKDCFDHIDSDDRFGQDNFELGETAMQGLALEILFQKRGLKDKDFDIIIGGDLTNQCIATGYAVREFQRPYLGIYSACSTVSESMLISALAVESGGAERVAALASSHFCTAERQYRFPLEYGAVRTPTSQRTATACGAFAIEKGENAPFIRAVTVGKIEDKGILDANNMGAAMAYAAYSTISGFLDDTGKSPDYFDNIITGDLGEVGTNILYELFDRDGRSIRQNHLDCGKMMYENMNDVYSGGSGAGCSSAVMAGHILPQIRDGKLRNVLFAATGALLSVTSVQQNRSIPCISHLVWLSNKGGASG